MGKINILEKSVAEKIAAGEVVERPASVVKELIENSFDAAATSVTVEIEKGGTSYIRVTDNGAGILREDVATAFLRHATSKIKDAGDLESIGTLGFRGEALCSISAVSKTEVITKTQSEAVGTYMSVEGGETKDYREAGCPQGTTVTVRNLFFNTPARMKFLKKDSTEAAFVTDICQRTALSHPEASFRYIRDGKEIFFTPGDNVLKNAVRAVFGKDISNAMLEVERSDAPYRIKGLTGSNNLSRPNRNMQFFFVNGRLVKSNILSAALSEAYKNELMVGRFPVCVLDIELPCEMVDVNVHPAKTEVKFADDEGVYRALVLAVKSAITKGAGPRAAFGSNDKAYKMPVGPNKVTQSTFKLLADDAIKQSENIKKAEKKTDTVKSIVSKPAEIKPKDEKKSTFKVLEKIKPITMTVSKPWELPEKDIEKLEVNEKSEKQYEVVKNDEKPEEVKFEPSEEVTIEQPRIPEFSLVGQLFATYIIIQTENEMIMIDQHAAHERINYERIKDTGSMKQALLMPITPTLSPKEKAAWEENAEFFDKMGFDVSDFGEGSVIIRTLPSDIDFADGEGLFIELLSSLSGGEKGEISYARDKAVYTIACKAAIKANKVLSDEEMVELCKKALAMEGISTCPHGRPISVKMTKYQIEKMFKRIV